MAWVHDSKDVTSLPGGQELELLRALGAWLADVWATGAKDIAFPSEWASLGDSSFWFRHLTAALGDQMRGLVKYQFTHPNTFSPTAFMALRSSCPFGLCCAAALPHLPVASASQPSLNDKVKGDVSLRYLDGKAVLPISRIPADALPFTAAAWRCCLLTQRSVFSAVVPDVSEAASFRVQLPVCTSDAGSCKDRGLQHEHFSRALRQQRPDWPVSLQQVTQALQYVEESSEPITEEFLDLVQTAPAETRC